MKIFVRQAVGLALVATCSFSAALWAEGFDPEGDPILEYQGPTFFGFVKETNGAPVPDAKVTLSAKGRDAVSVRTNSVGVYRASLGKDVNASDVAITCEKTGFKQARLLRRTEQNARAETPIEIECTLMADAAH